VATDDVFDVEVKVDVFDAAIQIDMEVVDEVVPEVAVELVAVVI